MRSVLNLELIKVDSVKNLFSNVITNNRNMFELFSGFNFARPLESCASGEICTGGSVCQQKTVNYKHLIVLKELFSVVCAPPTSPTLKTTFARATIPQACKKIHGLASWLANVQKTHCTFLKFVNYHRNSFQLQRQ